MNTETARVLPDLTQDAAAATIAALRAQIEAMKIASQSKLTLKVSEKGALCVYGLGRFPVTLYASQWDRLLTHAPAIRSFMVANAATLAKKA